MEIPYTGEGIPDSEVGKLFRPFERLGQKAVEGTGLGLALSQRLVEQMGGKLCLESTSEAGSTFFIELQSAGTVASSPREAPTPEEPRVESVHERLRILYIEDTLSNIQLMERAMESSGDVELIVAEPVGKGCELAESYMPDLVLLDVHLPDEEGDVVLQKLKQNPKTAHIPVVVVSADATTIQVERLMAAGAKTYLTSP